MPPPQEPATYSALLDAHENQCTLNCGCKLTRPCPPVPFMESHSYEGMSVAITFCPMHKASNDLLAACKRCLPSVEYHNERESCAETLRLLKFAIAKAAKGTPCQK